MEYKLFSWLHFKLMNEEGQIRVGTFKRKSFKIPHRLPPVDETTL